MALLTTFSVVAFCRRTGMVGVAVATAVPAATPLCAFARAATGAIATQAWVNPYLGIDGLRLLADGSSAKATLDRLLAGDPGKNARQVSVVDRSGEVAAFTGPDCPPFAAHRVGDGFAIQGNLLLGRETIDAMCGAAERDVDLALPERLMRILEAGQQAGGDRRGKQSAGMLICKKEEYPFIDIRVDDHPSSVEELRRVLRVVEHQLLPLADGLPTRENPVPSLSPEVAEMIMKPPHERPGFRR
jgi:uncharacterized Ntn-hydrolase superfamily protein